MKKQDSRGWKETIELEQDTKSEQKERTNQESHGRNIPVDLAAIPSRAAQTDINAEKEIELSTIPILHAVNILPRVNNSRSESKQCI